MRRRISLWKSVAVAALLAPAPLAAQSATQATPAPTPTPTPTPTPAPAGDIVGPPQLRDFNLNGTVTQPAQPVTTPTPTPVPAPRAAPPRTAPAPVADAPVRATPAPRLPVIAAPDSDPAPDAVTVDLPPSTTAPLESGAPLPTAPAVGPSPILDAPSGQWWPWLGALLAAALGAALLWWRRRPSGERYATDDAALGAVVTSPDVTPKPLPRAAPTMPLRPAPRIPAPPPAAAPAAVPAPVPTPPATPMPDGIFASRLKPELAFELNPIRAETDTAEGAALTFDLVIINRGSAPARDVLIEAQMINSSPRVDADVGRFFAQPAGSGERLPVIAPMARVSVRTQIVVASADLAPLVIDGRKLLVPVVAINAVYRWSGGELKDSSSFLVGRGEADGGKMAPFRLDRGARSWSDVAARLHSSGLKR